jgi:RNA polymerase sigma-70 factor (ECF subfamily)
MEQPAISAELLKSNFERVFLEQYPRVYAVLVRIVGDRAEAEDLALETFWQLHRRPPSMRHSQSLGGWLYRVATNLGFNALRARKRRERYELEAGAEAIIQVAAGDPAEDVAAQEERDRVRQVLGQMDSRQAQLLLMRHSGMAYEELAAALEVSPNSIGTLLARAEREFEKKWQTAIRTTASPLGKLRGGQF